jgi:hypothetical protein
MGEQEKIMGSKTFRVIKPNMLPSDSSGGTNRRAQSLTAPVFRVFKKSVASVSENDQPKILLTSCNFCLKTSDFFDQV